MGAVTVQRDHNTRLLINTIREHAPSPFDHVVTVDECGAPIVDPDRAHLIPCENNT